MRSKYLNQSIEDLKNTYAIDAINDIILSRKNRLFFYAKATEQLEDMELKLISGVLSEIGFDDQPSISMKEILDSFDYDSDYSKVAGRKEYYQGIVDSLKMYASSTDVTLPIKNESGRYWIRIYMAPVDRNPEIITIFVTNVTDVLDEEEALFLKTHCDSLTGLFNKYTLDYHFGKRYKFDDLHVLYLDLDDFKIINDTYGHKKGNEYLKKFAELLQTYEKDYNRFYRVGGDEFVGLFFEEKTRMLRISEEIIEKAVRLNDMLSIEGASVSMGVVAATSRDDVIRKADKLMYKSKKMGKNRYLYEIETI